MARIYSTPDYIEIPKFDFLDVKGSNEREDKFIEQIRAELKKVNPDDEYCGEIIKFPRADSYAFYMVFTVNPPQLVHLPIGDNWEYPYDRNLKAKDVLAEIKKERAIKKLFGNQKQ